MTVIFFISFLTKYNDFFQQYSDLSLEIMQYGLYSSTGVATFVGINILVGAKASRCTHAHSGLYGQASKVVFLRRTAKHLSNLRAQQVLGGLQSPEVTKSVPI